jgi:hypothetical protein
MSLSPSRQQLEEAEAKRYAALIRSPGDCLWSEVNAGIIRLYSVAALKRIKRRAWQIVEGSR